MCLKKILLAIIFLMAYPSIGISEDSTTIFETDFEDYDIGTIPSDFTIYYNGKGNSYQVITSNEANSGSKSLQVWGSNGWCSNIHYYFDLPESGIIGYEVWVKASPKEEGWVQFVNPEGASWTRGWGGVGFDQDGYITAPGGFKRPYTGDKWYKVEAEIDVETGKCWVKLDGELVTNGITPYQDGVSNPGAYKGIRGVVFGDCSWYESPSSPTYFDDFKFYVGSRFNQDGDIRVSQTVSPPDCFAIKIENTGKITFDHVKLVDTLPMGVSFDSATSSSGHLPSSLNDDGTTTVIWEDALTDRTQLAPGEWITIYIGFNSDSNENYAGKFANLAEVEGITSAGSKFSDSNSIDFLFSSGFTPSKNGFAFRNPDFLGIHFLGATCLGMSSCAWIYYLLDISPGEGICNQEYVPRFYQCLNIRQIYALHLLANLPNEATYWLTKQFSNVDSETMSSDYLFLRNRLINDIPVVLTLGPDYVGHAVVAYKAIEYGKTIRIFIYDPNSPGNNNQYIELDSITKSFNYGKYFKYYCTLPFSPEIGAYLEAELLRIAAGSIKFLVLLCPADLEITDPDGLIIDKGHSDISDVIYLEDYYDEDSDLDDLILMPELKTGYYTIKVVPESGADPDETYTLALFINDEEITLAKDVKIRDIPEHPYIIEVLENGEVVFLGYPEISVEKNIERSGLGTAQDINYTINVTNSGGIDLDSVEVVDKLPTYLDYVSSLPAGANQGKEVAWSLGSLASGDSIQLQLAARNANNDFENLTNLVNATGIPEVGEMVEDSDVCIFPKANITVSMAANLSNGLAGSLARYTIEVKNNGYADLDSVQVEDIWLLAKFCG